MATTYEVVVANGAANDLQRTRDSIARDKSRAAERWLRSFWRKANSLSTLPFRYEVVPEAAELDVEFRHLLFGNYRIIYLVQDRRVTVVRVMHAAQLLRPEDLTRRLSSLGS